MASGLPGSGAGAAGRPAVPEPYQARGRGNRAARPQRPHRRGRDFRRLWRLVSGECDGAGNLAGRHHLSPRPALRIYAAGPVSGSHRVLRHAAPGPGNALHHGVCLRAPFGGQAGGIRLSGRHADASAAHRQAPRVTGPRIAGGGGVLFLRSGDGPDGHHVIQ